MDAMAHVFRCPQFGSGKLPVYLLTFVVSDVFIGCNYQNWRVNLCQPARNIECLDCPAAADKDWIGHQIFCASSV